MLVAQFEQADACGHIDVECVQIGWVAFPAQRLAASVDVQPSEALDLVARPVVARYPLRIKQRQRPFTHRQRFAHLKHFVVEVGCIDVQGDRTEVGRVACRWQALRLRWVGGERNQRCGKQEQAVVQTHASSR